MNNIINQLIMYFEYDFVQYAMIVGVLISLCSSILGVSLVMKRMSYIGDSLAHVAFGIMSVGAVLPFLDNMFSVLLLTILISVAITRNTSQRKIKGDALLTMLSVSSLGIGYLVMNLGKVSANLAADVCATLFGSTQILTLSKEKVVLSIVLSIVVVFVYIFFYHKIFAVTFDEDFATATGVKVTLYNTIISIVLAVIIVLAVNLVGSLLISALIIFPALASMRVFKSFKTVIISSAVFSVLCSSIGIIISILISTPVGATIVAVDLAGFILFAIIGMIKS